MDHPAQLRAIWRDQLEPAHRTACVVWRARLERLLAHHSRAAPHCKVYALGMDFGLWAEPERVNPDSDLYRNLYWILQHLRERHPKLEIESCSGGGGRLDLGILRFTDEVWPSDNTDPSSR
jgi:Melibiase